MALQKSHVNRYNNSGNYWRIAVSPELTPDAKLAVINVSQYKDKATRDAPSEPNEAMDQKRYEVSDTDYDTYFAISVLNVVNQNSFQQAYLYLKTLDGTDENGVDFTVATDVPVGGGPD